MHTKPMGLSLLLAAWLSPLATTAAAQPAPSTHETQVAAEEVEEEEDDEREDPMAWLGLGFKVGVGGSSSSEIAFANPSFMGVTVPGTIQTSIESRSGLQLSVPINLGGDGFGFMLEPYLNMHTLTFRPLMSDMFASTVSEGRAMAMGVYLGPTINLHLADPFYFGFGFGLKAAYISADHLNLGLDLGGRVPITATFYVTPNFGLVAEVGLGYTATGYVKKPPPGASATEIAFGSAFAWDFSAGVRWP